MEVRIYRPNADISCKTYKSTLSDFEICEDEIVVKEDQWGESFSAEIKYTLPDLSAYYNPKVKLFFMLENGTGHIFVDGVRVDVGVSDEFIDVEVNLDVNSPKALHFTYSNKKLTSIADGLGRTVRYNYDSKKLQSVVFADGSTLTFKYSSDLMRSIDSGNGLQTKLSYDKSRRITEIKTAALSTVIHKNTVLDSTSYNFTISDYKMTYCTEGEIYVYIEDEKGNFEKYEFAIDNLVIGTESGDITGKTTAKYSYKFVEDLDKNINEGRRVTKITKTETKNEKAPVITITEYNEAELPVTETVDWQSVSDTVRIKTVKEYAYGEGFKLIGETTTKHAEEEGEEEITVYRTAYNYNSFGDLKLTESYVEGEEKDSGRNFEERVYNDDGNVVKLIRWNSLDSSSKFYTESEYENGRLLKEKDETGATSSEYEYEDGTNVVKSVRNAKGVKFAYGRNPYNYAVESVTQSTEDGEANANEIIYNYGAPVTVTSGNTKIDYSYDGARRKTEVSVNGVTQAKYSYKDFTYNEKQKKCTLGEMTTVYETGNGTVSKHFIKTGYMDGESGKIAPTETLDIDGNLILRKSFDENQRLVSVTDAVSGTSNITYDEFDNITRIVMNNHCEDYVYDGYGKLLQKQYKGDLNQTYRYTYKYNAAHDLNYITFGSSVDSCKFKPLKDVNGRNVGKEIYKDTDKVAAEYITYRKVGDHATNMPATIWFGNGTQIKDSIKYKYDSCGNICEITENGHIVAKYAYDSLNRLIREDNKAIGKTVLFTYDNAGNLTERCEYAYTRKSGEELSEQSCTHYSYDYDGDKLKSYNGKEITYNSAGNPTAYCDKVVEWQYGKRLVKLGDTTFAYDGAGKRTQKGNITFKYDSDGKLVKQSDGLEFIYDASGVVGLIYRNMQYFYRKDAQGNVVAILNASGNVVVKYVYDAWGNHKVIDVNGNEVISGIGVLNPFRYRGYYYDTETGLYYLQTRYYDPEVGRFISQDSVEYADPEKINGINLYAYCGNNPVMNVDPTGTTEWWEWLLLGIATALVIGAGIVAAVATGGLALVAGGIAIGGSIGGLTSIVGQGLINGWDNISIGGIAAGIFIGGALGGLGALVGGASVGAGALALAGGGTVFAGVAVVGVGLLAFNVLFSKHNPGMSNKPPVSWTDIDEGINIYNKFGGNSNKAAEYLLNQFRGSGNWHKGAGTEFNALKKWFDRIIRLMISK